MRAATSHPPRPDRDAPLIVAAVGVSALGDFLLWIPLTLHLLEVTGSGVAVAALMICLWAPVVLLAPLAGLLADRVETRGLLIIASLSQAATAVGLALAVDSVAAILVLAALLGIGFAVAQPAEFALVPSIAGERGLAVLNGRVEAARYVGMTAGPLPSSRWRAPCWVCAAGPIRPVPARRARGRATGSSISSATAPSRWCLWWSSSRCCS